ncbi:MAG: GNAT family N-acetyltransferase [Pseudomonadota bacterium]
MFTPHWQLASFSELSTSTLYRILLERQAVFIVEQHCAYPDIDTLDYQALHLIGYPTSHSDEILAYLRILPPNTRYSEPSLGRILTPQKYRNRGLGKLLMEQGIYYCNQFHPNFSLRISAQAYLKKFYESFDFKTVSSPYLEDNIPHIDMLRTY